MARIITDSRNPLTHFERIQSQYNVLFKIDYFTGLEKKHHQLPLMEQENFSKETFELLITKTISPSHQIALKFTSRWSGLVSLTQISFPFYLYKQKYLV